VRAGFHEQVLETPIAELEGSAKSHTVSSFSNAGGFADTHLQNQSFHFANIPVKRGVELPDVFTIRMSRLVPEH
jgi:hypothetical protein